MNYKQLGVKLFKVRFFSPGKVCQLLELLQ